MNAPKLPIPLSDEEVITFVATHGKGGAAKLLGLSRRGLRAVIKARWPDGIDAALRTARRRRAAMKEAWGLV